MLNKDVNANAKNEMTNTMVWGEVSNNKMWLMAKQDNPIKSCLLRFKVVYSNSLDHPTSIDPILTLFDRNKAI